MGTWTIFSLEIRNVYLKFIIHIFKNVGFVNIILTEYLRQKRQRETASNTANNLVKMDGILLNGKNIKFSKWRNTDLFYNV